MVLEVDYAPEENFANKLAKVGYKDFYVISRENARRLLTEKRIEIIEKLKEKEVESVRDLSRKLGRDVKQVSEDLELLCQMSIIEYSKEGNRKIPELKHQKIFIEPI